MIVCSCNVLSDAEVRTVASTATRRTTTYVYSCLGCRARCGRCARTIREIMDEVLDGKKVGCPVGGALHAAPSDKQP
jgi:bacterioferritin-associated ferredoxin